jgi:Family of unknown function (DUF6459)
MNHSAPMNNERAKTTDPASPSTEPRLAKKLYFPYAGPANGLDQSSLPLFGYEPALATQAPVKPLSRKLYLVPRPIYYEGEEIDPEAQPKPSPLSDLPELEQWVSRYLVTLIEIWSGRRAAMQLARWTHRNIFDATIALGAGRKALPKIRNIYISQPIDGVGEVTATLRYDERVRSLVMRFEGVDKRWLCTELILI